MSTLLAVCWIISVPIRVWILVFFARSGFPATRTWHLLRLGPSSISGLCLGLALWLSVIERLSTIQGLLVVAFSIGFNLISDYYLIPKGLKTLYLNK